MHRSKQPACLVVLTIVLLAPGGMLGAQEDVAPRFDWTGAPAPAPLLLAADETSDPMTGTLQPAVAGGMSALLPGAGQFYNDQGVKGSLMLAGFVASVVYGFTAGVGDQEVCAGAAPHRVCDTHTGLNNRFWIGLGSAAGIQAWSILDAIAVANRRAGR